MRESLSKKVGPLPVWGWALIAGGTLGMVILVKRARSKEAKGTEPIPEHLNVGAPEIGAGGGGGGPGFGEVSDLARRLAELETKSAGATSAATTSSEPSAVSATPVSEFLATERELEEGGYHRAPTGSAAPATAQALSTARGGPVGRGGVPYTAGKYKGMAAHIYARAVSGGVGPARNVIVLGHAGKKTHAAKPNHAPAHAKAKVKHRAHAPQHPRRHSSKPHRPARRR